MMEIPEAIDITSAYRVGEKVPGITRTLKMKLGNPGQKGLIFQHISNLRNKENTDGIQFQLNDHVIGEKAEDLKWNREVIKENAKLTTAEKLIITTRRGKLYTEDDTLLTSDLKCPSKASIIDIELQRLEHYREVLSKKTVQGTEQKYDGSTFVGYSMEATTVEEINEVYTAVRIANMDAQHIVCAYRLPGPHIAKTQHFCDDGEVGEGRKLMHQMRDANILNRAVFVVRRYLKQIGGVRHVLYRNAASSAIAISSFNNIRNETQVPWKIEEIKSKRDFVPKNGGGRFRGRTSRGRGGGRGSVRVACSSTQWPTNQKKACKLPDTLTGWDSNANQWNSHQRSLPNSQFGSRLGLHI